MEYTDEDFDRHMAPEEPWFVESWDTEEFKSFGWLTPAEGAPKLGPNELFVNF